MSGIRETRIDLVRGVSLLLIFIDHSSVSFSEAVQQSRGFSDAAELFVMMAGMSAALAYSPASGTLDVARVLVRTWARAFRLYWIHLLLVAGLIAAVFALPERYSSELRAIWGLDRLFAEPYGSGFDALMLRYLPADLDILPLYVLLIAAIPLFLVIIERSARVAITLSVGLWLVVGIFHLNLPNLAAEKPVWYFNPFSWQLVFVCGLLAGLRVRRGKPPFPYFRPLFIAALVFALIAVPLNLLVHFSGIADGSVFRLLLSKTSEGPLRLFNALAIVYVVFNLDALKQLATNGLLRSVFAAGRNSMPVFVTGTILSAIVTACVIANGSLALPLELLAVIFGVALQLALALERDRRKQKPSGEPKQSLMVASQADHDYGYVATTPPAPIEDVASPPTT